MALDAEGWTILTPSGDSRLIYVSTSGSDSNDGFETSLRAQRKGAWDTDLEATAVADWIRAGFDMQLPESAAPAFFFGGGSSPAGRLTVA